MTVPNSSPHSESTQQPPTKATQVSRQEILDILAACDGAGLPETIEDDTMLVLDSYVMVWVQHLLEERHGIVVNLSGETAAVDSVRGLHALVNRDLGVGAG